MLNPCCIWDRIMNPEDRLEGDRRSYDDRRVGWVDRRLDIRRQLRDKGTDRRVSERRLNADGTYKILGQAFIK